MQIHSSESMTLAGTKCASGRLKAYFIPIKITLMLEFNIQYSD